VPAPGQNAEAVRTLRANPILAGNNSELRKLQENLLGVVADVYRAKKEGRRPSEEQLRQGCAEFQLFCQHWDSLRIDGDRLLTITLASNGRQPERERVVCPAAIRRELIWDTHKQAHTGVQRVFVKLQFRWFWRKMGRDVRLKVRQCEGPVSMAVPLVKRGGGGYIAGQRWQVVAVDLVDPMPLTPDGNSWILVLTDYFTRWTDALTIPDASAPTVACVLDQNVFCYLGLPEQIHSDQGAQFQFQQMSDLCRLRGVNQNRTTPYHLQGNGVVKRNNRMLSDALRSLLLGRGQEEWDTVLLQVT